MFVALKIYLFHYGSEDNNLKITKQRVEVIDSIVKLGNDATISNLVLSVNMNKSTIYRILDILLNNNIVEKDINYENDTYYKLKSNHKHYLKCVKCKKVMELDNCPIDHVDIDDFEVINHNLKIEGICKQCRKV